MGAWIEILKVERIDFAVSSHPTMGAWIEIDLSQRHDSKIKSRTPRWVRGLKSVSIVIEFDALIVAPHDGCVDWN